MVLHRGTAGTANRSSGGPWCPAVLHVVRRSNSTRMTDSRATLDLDAYAARYKGRGRVLRLRFVAWRSAPEMELAALRLAIDAAKRGRDTALYKDLISQAAGRLGPDYALDEGWVAATDKWAATELERLRRELEDNKQQNNKEVIRAGHNDLGDFFYARGKMTNARGEFITMRDYCTHANHHIAMCRKVVAVCLEASEFHHVENYVHMAENVPEADSAPIELSKMRCSAGLALIMRGKYKDAAQRFLSTPIDTTEEKAAAVHALFSDSFCLEDIATYAGICALATLDRKVLMSDVLGSSEFRSLLELAPDVRELIHDFCATRYTSCLAYLEKLRPDLMLDPFLGRDGHVEKLYGRIRSKALIQYVRPFESVDLSRMANVFNTEVKALEGDLFTLIENGQINARIDTQNASLRRKKRNVRRDALANALETGEMAFDDTEAMLLRMHLSKNNMTVAYLPPTLSRTASGLGPRISSMNSADNLNFPYPT